MKRIVAAVAAVVILTAMSGCTHRATREEQQKQTRILERIQYDLEHPR